MRIHMKSSYLSLFSIIIILLIVFAPISFGHSLDSMNNSKEIVQDSSFDKVQETLIGGKDYWAVLIAINDYHGSMLPYSINEITQFKQTLLNGGNWEESNILTITDEHATIDGIIQGIQWLENKSDADDTIIFYFVGHGDKEDDGEYLIAYDGKIRDDELDSYLDTLSGTLITIIDTCYSGGFIEELKQRNRIILTASKDTENTYQVKALRSGIFGYFLNLTLESYTKFAEGTFLLTWLFSIQYSNQLSETYNESYTIHPQFYDGTVLRTRLINKHALSKNIFLEFFRTLLSSNKNTIFTMNAMNKL